MYKDEAAPADFTWEICENMFEQLRAIFRISFSPGRVDVAYFPIKALRGHALELNWNFMVDEIRNFDFNWKLSSSRSTHKSEFSEK